MGQGRAPRDGIERVAFRRPDGKPLAFECFTLASLFERADRGELGDSLTRPERTDFYVVLVGIRGATAMRVDFVEVPVRAGHVSVIAPGRVRQLQHPRGRADAWMMIFEAEFLGDLATRLTIASPWWPEPTVALEAAARPRVLALADAIHAEDARPADAYQPELVANLLRALLLHAERSQQTWSGVTALTPLARFFAALERDHSRTRSVSDYARECGLSPRRLGELVTAATGKSTKTAIDERVVLELKRLLAYTELSVKELAERVGFEEPTNLVKFFRLHTGTTPAAFRAQHRVAVTTPRTFSPSGRRS